MTPASPWIEQLLRSDIPVYPSVTGPYQPITAASLAACAAALAWCWALLLSFIGWGRMAARLVRVQLGASVACAAGIGVAILFGGVLNLLHGVYAPVLWAWTGCGILLCAIFRSDRVASRRWLPFWKRSSRTSRALLTAALLLLAVRALGTVRLARFDVTDDSAAYLTLPQKMLATHHFAADPFSERRITSSLGGSYFLQDEVLSAAPLTSIGMADRTLGFVLLAGVVFEIGILFELSAFQICLLELLVYLVPQQTFNLTFIVLPVSLLLAMVWLILSAAKDSLPPSSALLAGVIGGAVITLKSTYLPAVGVLALLPWVFGPARRWPLRFLWTAAGILLILLPWMIAMKSTSGTWLFPLLGRGYDYSRYGLFPAGPHFSTLRSEIKVFLQGAVLLVLAGGVLAARPRSRLERGSLAVLLGCALAITAMNYETSADSIWRYNFPQFFLAVLIFYAVCAAISNRNEGARRTGAIFFYCGIAVMLSMLCYYDLEGARPRPLHALLAEWTETAPVDAGLSGRALVYPSLLEQYRRLNRAIPTNGIVLEQVAYSFLLDNAHHRMYMLDWPGTASPLPGWPLGKGPGELGRYLRGNGIRYIVLDRSYILGNDAKGCRVLLGGFRVSTWTKQQIWLQLLVDEQLRQLSVHNASIYLDGSMEVVDLDRPGGDASPSHTTWSFGSSADAVCSGIAEQYFTANR